MKTVAAIVFTLYFATGYCQETSPVFDGHKWEAPYELPIPKDWTIERFLIPISFAPQIPYKGIEDIRFTPGWGKATSDDYWSYAFLWYLDGDIKMDTKTIETNLKNYYTGLVSVNGGNIPTEKIIPVKTSFTKVKEEKDDIETYTGTIMMTDYMQQKQITLNCKAHLQSCPGENKTFVFYELSPQAFFHTAWISLDKLWDDFKCKKK